MNKVGENVDTELVPAASRAVTTQQMEDAGLMMPLVDPAALRAAFAERQRVLTSILDPERDFLYSIKYYDPRDGNRQRTMLTTSLKDAQAKVAHLGLGASYSAHPKKSGVLKLAHALGIESRRIDVAGLPADPRVNYSVCRYMATHKRTGRQEEGQGYCDKSEKGGSMNNHAIISMADTRAYCHAVLRCAGYDNVGAEEIELVDVEPMVVITNEPPPVRERERPALVETTSPTVLDVSLASTPARETVAARPAATPAQAPTAATAPVTKPEPEPSASGAASETSGAAPTDPAPAMAPVGPADVITNAMAGELSKLLMAKLGSKPQAQKWLMDNAGVERSVHVREDQIGDLTKKLNAMETP